jgi:hypothetical protein
VGETDEMNGRETEELVKNCSGVFDKLRKTILDMKEVCNMFIQN